MPLEIIKEEERYGMIIEKCIKTDIVSEEVKRKDIIRIKFTNVE